MKFASFDENGFPTAFYDQEINGGSIPATAVEIEDAQWFEFLQNPGRRIWSAGAVIAYDPPPPPPTIEDYRNAIQSLVDQTAQSRKYDNGNSLASYAASTNQAWSAEAQAFIAWRDQVWAYAYTELDRVQNGERNQPTVEEFIAELPVIEWPLD